MVRAAEKLSPARVTISTQIKRLGAVVTLKAFKENQEENVAFYKTREDVLKNEITKTTTNTVKIGALLDCSHGRVNEYQDKQTALDSVARLIFQTTLHRSSCTSRALLKISLWAPASP